MVGATGQGRFGIFACVQMLELRIKYRRNTEGAPQHSRNDDAREQKVAEDHEEGELERLEDAQGVDERPGDCRDAETR